MFIVRPLKKSFILEEKYNVFKTINENVESQDKPQPEIYLPKKKCLFSYVKNKEKSKSITN